MLRNHRLAVAASIGVLIATGGAAQASSLTSASAGQVVCPHSCEPQPIPAECDDLTAQDQAAWDNYWYNGVPLPHPELEGLYAECFGF